MTDPVGGVPNSEDSNSKWLPNFPEAEAKGTFNADNLVFKQAKSKKEPVSDETAKKVYKEHLEKTYPEYAKQAQMQREYSDLKKSLKDIGQYVKGDDIPKDANIGDKALAWGGRAVRGASLSLLPLAALTGCKNTYEKKGTKVVIEYDPKENTTTQVVVIDADLNAQDKTKINEQVKEKTNDKVNDLNSQNPRPQTKDGVGYTYALAEDGKSGNIKLDGTNIVLPFDIKTKEGEAKINEDHSLDLTTNIKAVAKNGVITPENLAEYINLLGGDVKAEDIKFTSSKTADGQEQITYANGFTHVVGDAADVKPESALGKLQAALGRLEMKPGSSMLTKAESGPAADGSAMGIKYELKSGNIKDITTGSPEVKFSVGDIAIEGKVSADKNGVVTITNGEKTITITPEKIGNIVNGSGAEGLTITSSDGKKYEIAYDPELTNPDTDVKDGNYCTIREVKPDGSRDTETFFKVDGNMFDATTPSTKYDNLYNAYEAAVDAFKTESTYHKEGTERIDEVIKEVEVLVKADAKISWSFAGMFGL